MKSANYFKKNKSFEFCLLIITLLSIITTTSIKKGKRFKTFLKSVSEKKKSYFELKHISSLKKRNLNQIKLRNKFDTKIKHSLTKKIKNKFDKNELKNSLVTWNRYDDFSEYLKTYIPLNSRGTKYE